MLSPAILPMRMLDAEHKEIERGCATVGGESTMDPETGSIGAAATAG